MPVLSFRKVDRTSKSLKFQISAKSNQLSAEVADTDTELSASSSFTEYDLQPIVSTVGVGSRVNQGLSPHLEKNRSILFIVEDAALMWRHQPRS